MCRKRSDGFQNLLGTTEDIRKGIISGVDYSCAHWRCVIQSAIRDCYCIIDTRIYLLVFGGLLCIIQEILESEYLEDERDIGV